ncbi:endonuclease or glycosyl hydrolase [Artemisia annua]|uniref:Endonuclease or glycosyl hydrolase n=1 Tax=Artemisia annua TaxID=35608 RepID=A0A2U1L6H3_ARTAN|nr:endonuclease or glycosyl hydrolase [Artemisia annua]
MSTQSLPQQNRNIDDGSIAISGDEDLSQALHVLKQRGYTVILIPPGVDGLTALKNAGGFLFECPGDVNGLKRQLVSLLESSGGQLPLERLRDTYHQTFKRPLIVKDYYHMTLMNLLGDMCDEIEITGEGWNKSSLGVSDLDELLVKTGDMVVLVEDRESKEKYVMCARLLQLRREVLKIRLKRLLSRYFGMILFSCFEELYESLYKYKLDYVMYGLNDLEELCEVLSDLLVVEVNPGGKAKLIKAVQ